MIPEREAKPHDLLDPRIPRVKRRLRKARLTICEGCEHYTPLNQCTQCGCFMPLKVTLPHAACPIGKWDAWGEQENTSE